MSARGRISRRLSAPGKVMVAGEYAVLEGVPALVSAVSARVWVSLSRAQVDGSPGENVISAENTHLSPEVRLSLQHAESRLGQPLVGELCVNVSALHSIDGQKYGLGSSSASAVAAAGHLFAQQGLDVREAETRKDLFETSFSGHRAVSPKGSGADVAASTFGGTLRFVPGEGSGSPQVQPLSWPDGLFCQVVWVGKPIRTSRFVDAVSQLKAESPDVYRPVIEGIADAASSMIHAFQTSDIPGLIEGARQHGHAMAELGRVASIPIVSDALLKVAELAESCGGSAKPSGAGGGDVALGFFDSEEARQRFCGEVARAGLRCLDLELGVQGVLEEMIDA